MKNTLKFVVIGFFIFFIALQFIRPDQINPAITETETLESAAQIPGNVATIFERSCSDCHTNKTAYPFYAKITPFNWFLARHIEDGRRELNFSIWNTYESRRKRRKLEQICEQITDGEMPLPSYLWIHRAAKLSDGDVKILCEWTESEKEKIAQTP